MEKSRNNYRVLVGKPLVTSRRRSEDNINMYLREVGCDPRD